MRKLGFLFLAIGVVFLIINDIALAVFLLIIGAARALMPDPQKDNAKKKTDFIQKRADPTPTPKKKKSNISYNKRSIVVPGAPAEDAYAYPGPQSDYFRILLTQAFPDYTLGCDVPVEKIPAVSGKWTCSCGCVNNKNFCAECGSSRPAKTTRPLSCPNVSYMLYKDGVPKLAILLGGRNDRDTMFRVTEKQLKKQGIPVQYYIDIFRNKASYVYSRVTDALK